MYSIQLNIGSLSNPVIDSGWLDVSPILDDVSIFKSRDQEYERVVRYGLDGNIIFNGDEYVALFTLKDSDEKYVPTKVLYNGYDKIQGSLSLNGFWDKNKGQCALKYNHIDSYSELLKNKEDPINLKNVSPEYTINREQIVTILYITLPCFSGTVEQAQQKYLPIPPNGEFIPGPILPPSADWIYWILTSTTPCDGGFVYSFEVESISEPADGWVQSDELENTYFKGHLANLPLNPLKYWFDLFNVTEDILNNADSAILKDRSTYCTYFTVDDLELNYLFVANKSDIKRNDSSNPALNEGITFSDWVRYFKNIWQLDWVVDSDGYFKFLRPSAYALPDFNDLPFHDLTNIGSKNYTDNIQRYIDSAKGDIFRETWMFEPASWLYYSLLDYEVYFKTMIEYNLININNDISYLIDDPDEASDSGLVFAACTYDSIEYVIINKETPYAEIPGVYINGKLHPTNLVKDNFSINRPYKSAKHERTIDISLEKAPLREVEFINLPIFDIDDIDFDYLVKSSVGDIKANYFSVSLNLDNLSILKGIF